MTATYVDDAHHPLAGKTVRISVGEALGGVSLSQFCLEAGDFNGLSAGELDRAMFWLCNTVAPRLYKPKDRTA
ncbi:MAG: hypothetical protein KGJ86_00615 [Chloroflexota bacterium]|nr:hypothetical protein [Chloroflexota bacterium]